MTTYLTNREALRAIADDMAIECQNVMNGAWFIESGGRVRFDRLDEPSVYRLAPTTITRTVTYPKPETKKLEVGQAYYTPDAQRSTMRCVEKWQGSEPDYLWLARGLVYLTESDAIARAKAMIEGVE